MLDSSQIKSSDSTAATVKKAAVSLYDRIARRPVDCSSVKGLATVWCLHRSRRPPSDVRRD